MARFEDRAKAALGDRERKLGVFTHCKLHTGHVSKSPALCLILGCVLGTEMLRKQAITTRSKRYQAGDMHRELRREGTMGISNPAWDTASYTEKQRLRRILEKRLRVHQAEEKVGGRDGEGAPDRRNSMSEDKNPAYRETMHWKSSLEHREW